MKIVLATHHFPPNYNAGAEQYVYRLAQGLQRYGHAIEVVCIESVATGSLEPTCVMDIYDNLVVHRLYFNLTQAPHLFEWRFRNPELGQWFEDYLQRTRPDIFHLNSGYLLGGTVIESAHKLNIPTVLTLHDYWFLCPLHTLLRTDGKICAEPVPPARCVWCSLSEKRRYRLPDTYINSRLGDTFVELTRIKNIAKVMGTLSHIEMVEERRVYLKQILETIDLVISPSQFLMEKVVEYGIKPRQMIYLPFGLDKTNLAGQKSGGDSQVVRLGYLGQFTPHKGVHLLLSAFQKLEKRPDSYRLVLYGKISEASKYERELLKMAQHDPAITFAGAYPNAVVGRVLNNLDAIVVPSVWYENRPTVIIEALATRTPVIAARLGGMAELIKHNQNGLLFEPGSIDGLAEQLQRLLDEPGLLAKLREGIEPIPDLEEELADLISHYEAILLTPQRTAALSLMGKSNN